MRVSIQFIHWKAWAYVAFLSLLNPRDLLQKWIVEEGLANRDKGKETKKEKRPKVIALGKIFEWHTNGVLANCGNVDTATTGEALDRQPENSKGEAIDIYEESSCEEINDDVSEEAMLAKISS